jgi:tetratricopeptide (TPR) repeat protein
MAESLDVAVAFAQAGRLAEAEKLCRDALKSNPTNPRALCLLASTANARKAHRQALDLLGKIRSPDAAPVHVEKAIAHLGLGAPEVALREARRAVEISPDVPGGYWLVSTILLPGEPYYAVLQRFHDRFKPHSYLEIGVDQGASITLANPPTVAIGIDPEPRLQKAPKTVCKIFPLTSDDYFAGRDVRRDMEADTVDLAFIDGLHTFDQVLRDFINIEKIAGQQTIVLVHDCLAIDTLTAERERKTVFWTGDVWKFVPILRENRPDLNVFTIAAPPSGLGVVSGLDPRSTVLADNYDQIVARYRSIGVEPDQARRREQAAVIANRWEDVEARLARNIAVAGNVGIAAL